jgi:hypothetical protein
MTKFNRFTYTYRQTPRACPKCKHRRVAITYGGRAYWHCYETDRKELPPSQKYACDQDDEIMRVLISRKPKPTP